MSNFCSDRYIFCDLFERESGTEQLRKARDSYLQALEVFRAAGVEYYIQITERNLSRVNELLESKR